MAARQVRQGREFVKHVVPAVMKPARTLWNEFIGFLFCCFGVIFGFKTARLAMDFSKASVEEGLGPLLRLAVAGFCTLLMLWFGIGSFLKARKISRS
jgi:hypothetical protein